jgi:hypothetical protein
VNSLLRPGDPLQVAEIVERLLNAFGTRRAENLPESAVEDWVRVLMEKPLLSVFVAYEDWIRRPVPFPPSPGQFLETVSIHEVGVEAIRGSLKLRKEPDDTLRKRPQEFDPRARGFKL